jgi:hypothetical protein
MILLSKIEFHFDKELIPGKNSRERDRPSHGERQTDVNNTIRTSLRTYSLLSWMILVAVARPLMRLIHLHNIKPKC